MSYHPPDLEIGVDYSGEDQLKEIVERELPEFAESVKRNDADVIMIHQDAFAAGYQTIEYLLLGMVIKYAGLYGKAVNVVGENHETFSDPAKN